MYNTNNDINNNIDNNIKNIPNIRNIGYGSGSFGSYEFGSYTTALASCPSTPKYSGDTVTLKATPTGGVEPYVVTFKKDGSTISTSRLGGLSNPTTGAVEDTQITRVYTLDDLDISSASTGTINFSVYIEDSCPTGPMSCTETCTISVGCVAPICNFTVT